MEKESQQFWFVVRVSRDEVKILSQPFTTKSDATLAYGAIADKTNLAVAQTVYHWSEYTLTV